MVGLYHPTRAVEDLHTQFTTHEGIVHAVDGVSFEVHEGAIVGEALPGAAGDLPDEAAERIEDAADALAAGEDGRAREIVREAFPAPCERQVPRSVETDAGHTVACHWSDPGLRRESVDAVPSQPRPYGG